MIDTLSSGYMSPEYAVDGEFSVKSDVFAFGVLLLEMLSNKRNRGFTHPDHHHNLVGHVSLNKLKIMLFLSYFLLFLSMVLIKC